MGQAKARGTLEQRIVQAQERDAEIRERREMDKRALARMDAANKRQAVKHHPGDVVIATHSSRERLRRSSPHFLSKMALWAALGAALAPKAKEPGR